MSRTNVENVKMYGCSIEGERREAPMNMQLNGSLTLDPDMPPTLILDANGAARSIIPPAASRGLKWTIINSAAGAFALNLRDAANANTLASVPQGKWGWMYSDGTIWYAGASA